MKEKFSIAIFICLFFALTCFSPLLGQEIVFYPNNVANKIEICNWEKNRLKCKRTHRIDSLIGNRISFDASMLAIGNIYNCRFKCQTSQSLNNEGVELNVTCEPKRNSKETGIIYKHEFIDSTSIFLNFDINFYVQEDLDRLVFESSSNCVLVLDSVILTSIDMSIENYDENLIVNPGFDYYSLLPDGRFNGTSGLYGWQNFNFENCLETRTSMHFDFKIENGETTHYNGISFGSPDFVVDSIDSLMINCCGRLRCDNYKVKKGIAQGEFLETKFLTPMIKDSIYTIIFDFKLDSTSKHASNGLGFKISDCAFSAFDKEFYENNTPHLATFVCNNAISFNEEWETAIFLYKAKGGENYITFGPFSMDGKIEHVMMKSSGYKRNYPGAYYLIDNIVVRCEKH